MITEIMQRESYDRYILEVADTNTNAVNLYKKLGFKEFHRVKEKHPKQSGLNEYIYMRHEKE